MKIYIIAVGTHMPAWVDAGFKDYVSRLKQDVKLELIEVAAGVRGKNADTVRILQEEGQRLLQAIPKNSYIIGLDVLGKPLSTELLADSLKKWLFLGQDIAILIGGPEGFAPEIIDKCSGLISLSNLTFPHPLVRIILAEQLYRAWSILHNHPYHRA
ncbi:23S rRNA m(3)Psi1915 pseudouridine methyltransferase [Gammaproteobacteria bacterium]|nr:23S rRNA m(3)Psi1915 pseudouridine methyltransferase [Gammaproteobacteria bacterium]